jgi:hypothetical protein
MVFLSQIATAEGGKSSRMLPQMNFPGQMLPECNTIQQRRVTTEKSLSGTDKPAIHLIACVQIEQHNGVC